MLSVFIGDVASKVKRSWEIEGLSKVVFKEIGFPGRLDNEQRIDRASRDSIPKSKIVVQLYILETGTPGTLAKRLRRNSARGSGDDEGKLRGETS
jgi:hypothetical protein